MAGGNFVRKTETRKAFQKWLAIPSKDRQPGTQKEFAELWDVHEETLSRWKKEPEFMEGVETIRRQELDEQLSDVYATLAKQAKEGDYKSMKLAFEMADRYTEKKEVNHNVKHENEAQNLSDDELASHMAERLAGKRTFKEAGIDKETLEGELTHMLKGEDANALPEPEDVEYEVIEEGENE